MNKKGTTVQTKSAGASNIKRPTAPAVYRPQPVPRVLQTKSALHQPNTSSNRTIAPRAAPPVYRPQVPKVLQAKPARTIANAPSINSAPHRCVQPKVVPPKTVKPVSPVIQRSTNKPASAPRSAAPRSIGAVIQRVTYKGVTYAPAVGVEQLQFQAVAKADMEREGTWAPGRSEGIIEQIGKTAETIESAAALAVEERKYWKEYDTEINEDLKILGAIQGAIDNQYRVLGAYLPRLRTDDLSVEVGLAVSTLQEALKFIPDKWNLQSLGGEQVEIEMGLLLKLRPWELQAAKRRDEATLEAETRDRLQKMQSGQLPQGTKPTKREKSLAKNIKTLDKEIRKVDERILRVQGALDRLPSIKQRIETQIRHSAAAQYGRGFAAHTGARSRMKNKKLYLGEIATTEAIFKNVAKPHKASGVLWASPWSPGVNIAFVEGGAKTGAVYKLKTAIPDNLKQLLVEGKHAEFRAAVHSQGGQGYRPFWQGQHGRFTIYTDELTYLAKKGYRLHEFRRKNGATQQIMVHPNQLDEVTRAYDGR